MTDEPTDSCGVPMDDQTTGSCVCCRRRDPREGYVCDACRSRFRGWLVEIPGLWPQLLDESLRPSGSPAKGGPVSGSREKQLPIRIDLFDLTNTGAHRKADHEDQVGHIPVWLTLATWARDWATYRGMGEVGSGADVTNLCSWLRERVDEMCDEHPAIDECWRDVRSLHGAMYAQLGLFDIPDYKYGVPCKSCNALALVHHNGSEWVECGECASLLSFQDFDDWVRLVATAVKKMEKAA